MTKYLNDAAFTVGMPTGQRFRDNWDRIFSKRKDEAEMAESTNESPPSSEESKKEG